MKLLTQNWTWSKILIQYRIGQILVGSLFFLGCFTISAQNQPIADSLISVLAKTQGEERLHLLYRIAITSSSPDDKIKYATQQIEEAVVLSAPKHQISGYRTLGIGHRKKGELKEALKYLFQSASLASEYDNKKQLSITYAEIATTYSKSGDIESSLAYNTRSIGVLRDIGDKRSLGITLMNTGYAYYKAEKYDTALLYYDEAKYILDSLGIGIGVAYTIGNKALVEWKLGQRNSAIAHLNEAIELLEPRGDEYGMADYYNQLGNIYYEESRLPEAAKALALGIKMASAVDLKEQMRDASKLLAEVYMRQGVLDSAYVFLHQYVAIRDTIASEETIQQLANQRADYEINLKQAEVDILKAKRRNQLIISSAVSIFLLLAVIVVVIVYKNYKQKLQLSQELAILNESQQKLFSIISHDLRGPMAAFGMLAYMIRSSADSDNKELLKEVADEVEKTSNGLTNLLENLLQWAVKQNSSMEVHLEAVSVRQLFYDLKDTYTAQAKAKKIQIDISRADSSQINVDRNMAYTIFRNLVSNAIKFTPKGGQVQVLSRKIGDKVQVKIVDSGVGIPKEKLGGLFRFTGEKSGFGTDGEKGLGLGLSLVKEFVETNNGTISVESMVGEGTTFTVLLPSQES